jgi:hypothetical protein
MNDISEAPLVEKTRRNPTKWKKSKGEGFNKSKKQYKLREQELHEDDLDQDARDYR